jgi:hypothetical protein
MKTLPDLIRSLTRRAPMLSIYSGEDWREYVLPRGKLMMYRDDHYSLNLVSTPANEEKLLAAGEYLVLQGNLYLRTGDRIRGYHRQSITVMSLSQGDTVHLELIQ